MLLKATPWLVVLSESSAASILCWAFQCRTSVYFLPHTNILVWDHLFVRFTLILIQWQEARLDVSCLSVGCGYVLLYLNFFNDSAFSDNFDKVIAGGG